jgi:hypothetical protein
MTKYQQHASLHFAWDGAYLMAEPTAVGENGKISQGPCQPKLCRTPQIDFHTSGKGTFLHSGRHLSLQVGRNQSTQLEGHMFHQNCQLWALILMFEVRVLSAFMEKVEKEVTCAVQRQFTSKTSKRKAIMLISYCTSASLACLPKVMPIDGLGTSDPLRSHEKLSRDAYSGLLVAP